MLRYIAALTMLLMFSRASGQTIYNTQGKPTSLTIINGSLTASKQLVAPAKHILPYFDSCGSIAFDSVTGQMYYHNCVEWVAFGSGGGGTTDTPFITSTIHDTADVLRSELTQYFPITGGIFQGNVSMNGYTLGDLNNPVNPGDAVNLAFVNTYLSGLAWKQIVKVATDEELPAFTYDGDNSIFFADGACPVIDGVTLELNDRVLNKNSTTTDTPFNGIFYVSQLGDVNTACILTRTSDANTAGLLNKATVAVSMGDANAGKGFTQTNTVTALNVSAITFENILDAVLNAGYGLLKNGNVLNVDTFYIPKWNDTATGKKLLTQYGITQGFKLANNKPIEFVDLTGATVAYMNEGGALWNAATSYIEIDPTSGYKYTEGRGSVYYTAPYVSSGSVVVRPMGRSYVIADSAQVVDSAFNRFAKRDSNTHANPITYDFFYNHLPTGADSSVYATRHYNDTGNAAIRASIVTQLAFKVNYTDTAGMLAPYLRESDTTTLSNRIDTKQNFTDTTTWDATRSWVYSQGYATSGAFISATVYSVAGTYTVTVPAGAVKIVAELRGGGGGSAACVGGSSLASLSGGGGAGGFASTLLSSWTSVVVTVGSAGSAGAISGCPSCVASAGGSGTASTINNGTTTTTAQAGQGGAAVSPVNQNRAVAGGAKTTIATNGNIVNGFGAGGDPGLQFGVISAYSGRGGSSLPVGVGGDAVTSFNTAGNAGGIASGGSGCISGTGTGAANSKNGAAGGDGYVILYFYR